MSLCMYVGMTTNWFVVEKALINRGATAAVRQTELTPEIAANLEPERL